MDNGHVLVANVALSKRQMTFGISNVPWILYCELRQRFGIGEEISWHELSDYEFHRRTIMADSHTILGRLRTIEVQRFNDQFTLGLWDYEWEERFQKEKESYERGLSLSYFVSSIHRPILELKAGMVSAGVWSAGRGNLLMVNAKVELKELNLRCPEIPFLVNVLLRAHQIAIHPQCVSDKYWEVQKNPNG